MQKITVRGTWEAMGRALGDCQTQQIRTLLRGKKLTGRLRKLVRSQTAHLRRRAPEALEMIVGLAEGSRQPFEIMLAVASWEYLFFGERCSTVFGKDQEGPWIAHNEDADPVWSGRLSVIRFVPDRGVSFISLQYAGTPPGMAAGVNTAGFGITMNDLHRRSLPPLIGDSPCVIGLRLLRARSWREIDAAYRTVRPNAGMHFLVADRSRARSLELYWDRKASAWVQPGFVHTNHPLLPQTTRDASASRSSRRRFFQLCTAPSQSLKDMKGRLVLPLKAGGASVNGKKMGKTLATVIIRPIQGTLEVIEKQKGRLRA